MPAHSLIVFGIAEGDGEMRPLSVTSREMLQCERRYKGFSAQDFFQRVTVENLYRVAFAVLGLRGQLDKAVKFDEFIDGWSVEFGDPSEKAPSSDTESDGDDDIGSEVDPTQTTA